ncbi:MAG: hypothetical protein ACRD2X_21215 [Vicinamibacteraceae bacterium]
MLHEFFPPALRCADDQRVAIESHRPAKIVIRRTVGRGQLRVLDLLRGWQCHGAGHRQQDDGRARYHAAPRHRAA